MIVWTVNRPVPDPGKQRHHGPRMAAEMALTFNVSLTPDADWPEAGAIPKRLVDAEDYERLREDKKLLMAAISEQTIELTKVRAALYADGSNGHRVTLARMALPDPKGER